MNLHDPFFYIPRYLKILTRADSSGQSQLVPMKLKPLQEYYLRNRTKRDICVKARQMGMTTGILAGNSHKIFTEPYHRMSVIAHRGDSSEFMLQTVHRFHNHLPDAIKPVVDWKSATRIRFSKLDSLIHIDSAQSRAIGRSESLTLIHLSEFAFWPDDTARELWAGISQTASTGALVTIESSPRGRGGMFYQMYQGAKRGDNGFKAFFFPWWWEPDYQLPVKGLLKLNEDEASMVRHFKLSHEQIAWRRNKMGELGELFYQEYPENDVDCWLGGETNVFDGSVLRRYLRNCLTGDVEGDLTTWKAPVGGHHYVIGVDAAAGHVKGDYSVAVVIDGRTCEQVATLRGKIPPDLFGEAIHRLGRKYNTALVGVEREKHGMTVLHVLMSHNYENLYHHRDYDVWVGKEVSEPGWVTSSKTKPLMVDGMKAAFRAGDFVTYSENLLNEALAYQYIGSNPERLKMAAAAGETDDELVAAMIALTIRENEPTAIEEVRYPVEASIEL